MAFTNPGKIVRLRSRPGGRGSVYEANMWAQQHSDGLFSGRGVIRNTVADMNVLVGGPADSPDVVLGKLPSGFLVALDLVGQQPLRITAPASNKRVASVVAYSDNVALNSTDTSTTGSPSSCGLIVVYGPTSASPTAPTDSQIRRAVTQDGATGSQAVVAIIANIIVESSTTTITSEMIVTNSAKLKPDNMGLMCNFSTNEVDSGKTWIDGRKVYRKVIKGKINVIANTNIFYDHGISGLTDNFEVISTRGSIALGGTMNSTPGRSLIPHVEDNQQMGLALISKTQLRFVSSYSWGNSEFTLVVEYVK